MSENSHLQADFLPQEHVRFLRQLNDQEFWDYASACAYAEPQETASVDAYLVCDLHPFGCILSLADLRTVIPSPTHFSLLPDSPGWLLGLTAWQGIALPVVDLKTYFLKHTYPLACPSGMLLITQYEDLPFGLLAPVVGMMANLDGVPMQTPEQIQLPFTPLCPDAIKGVSLHTEAIISKNKMEMAFLLDLPTILADVVKCTRATPAYG